MLFIVLCFVRAARLKQNGCLRSVLLADSTKPTASSSYRMRKQWVGVEAGSLWHNLGRNWEQDPRNAHQSEANVQERAPRALLARMHRTVLLDYLRRIVPIRYRQRIPMPVRRAIGYVYRIKAAILLLLALVFRALDFGSTSLHNEPAMPPFWRQLRAMGDFILAKGLLLNNEFLRAREKLDRSIANVADRPDTYYLRGHVQVVLNEPEAAIADLTRAIRDGYDSAEAHFYLALAYSNIVRNTEAVAHYRMAIDREPRFAQALVNLAHLLLWDQQEDEAVVLLRQAILIDPGYSMAHQNIAALYNKSAYKPAALDLEGRREFLLIDAYNFAGERAFHVGRGNEIGVRLWRRALLLQREIARDFSLPPDIVKALHRYGDIDWNLPFRILPYEWVTQIGHIAMLDSYCKIQRLGWRPPANLLLLAPWNKVVNPAYLAEWRKYFVVIEDETLVDSLFPYQRFIGDCFNAYLEDDDSAIGFPDAGARAQIAWDEAGHGPLLVLSDEHKARGRAALEALGLPPGAWFACLHAREGGFYREGVASTQAHRNTTVADYLPTMRNVVERGGWVVRLGDRSMTPLPPMQGVIDYAHSDAKSDWMDVYLCGAGRFYIGTTSGLTNMVISYGVPSVLVNCLSNFSQLWNNRVSFILKPFWSQHEQRYLKLHEMINEPVRSSVFNIRALNELGIVPHNNSAAEIADAVHDLMEELESHTVAQNDDISVWRQAMAANVFFGNGRPCPSFLAKYRRALF